MDGTSLQIRLVIQKRFEPYCYFVLTRAQTISYLFVRSTHADE